MHAKVVLALLVAGVLAGCTTGGDALTFTEAPECLANGESYTVSVDANVTDLNETKSYNLQLLDWADEQIASTGCNSGVCTLSVSGTPENLPDAGDQSFTAEFVEAGDDGKTLRTKYRNVPLCN